MTDLARSHENRRKTSVEIVAQTGIAFTWAGLVIGLSFIETPLKFHAPGITQALAVGIGRLVFATLNRIELILAVLLFAALLMGGRSSLKYCLFGLILALVLTQTFWLLPALDARARLFIEGLPAPASFHHVLFIATESVKLAALLTFGIVTARR